MRHNDFGCRDSHNSHGRESVRLGVNWAPQAVQMKAGISILLMADGTGQQPPQPAREGIGGQRISGQPAYVVNL